MKKVVCVTGATGYIASWLVKLLLNHGYTVHATVRNPYDQTKVEHLFNLEGAKERLHLFKADLMEEGSFDSAISGCQVVYTGQLRAPEVVVDESWFSDPELCKESSMMWYMISKTLAEDAAWKFAKENNIDMISINPGMVIGPMLQPSLTSSVALILNLINGANTYPNATFGWVHVKDVATAHILAFEVQSASGRHNLVESVSHCSEIVKILQELCPALTLPDKCADDKPFAPLYQVSKVKAKDDPTKIEHLLALDGAEKRLHLYEANLLEEGSFDSAIHGCDGVFHTATPIVFFSENAEAEVIDPAVKGTLNVLASCAKAPSVKRVVFTSSSAAVAYTDPPPTNETVVDETWFSSPEGCKGKKGECYLIAKTLAEDAAWKFAKENGIDMVSINPTVVIGPLLQPTINVTTIYFVLNLIQGSDTYPRGRFGWVHVKDVAEAHIRALEIPSANGRYILSETTAEISDIVKILHELYPSLKLPDKCEDDQPPEPTYTFSKDKAKTLGIEFVPLKNTLKETIECLKERFKIRI